MEVGTRYRFVMQVCNADMDPFISSDLCAANDSKESGPIFAKHKSIDQEILVLCSEP